MKKSILNKIDNEAVRVIMDKAVHNFPSLIEYDEIFKEIWKKCPGLEFLVQNANWAYDTGRRPENQEGNMLSIARYNCIVSRFLST